jgi:hypothetical protein
MLTATILLLLFSKGRYRRPGKTISITSMRTTTLRLRLIKLESRHQREGSAVRNCMRSAGR